MQQDSEEKDCWGRRKTRRRGEEEVEEIEWGGDKGRRKEEVMEKREDGYAGEEDDLKDRINT